METPEDSEQFLIRQSESPPQSSMLSVTVGRAMTSVISARSKKLLQSLSRLPSPHFSNRPPLGSLEDSLWFLHKYATDVAHKADNLDEIFVPLLQHCLRSKELKGQAMILINWLFEDVILFEFVANSLVSVIGRKEDHYVALGWCVLVRGIVDYESFSLNQCTLHGIRDNYIALLKILGTCIPRLLQIVCSGRHECMLSIHVGLYWILVTLYEVNELVN